MPRFCHRRPSRPLEWAGSDFAQWSNSQLPLSHRNYAPVKRVFCEALGPSCAAPCIARRASDNSISGPGLYASRLPIGDLAETRDACSARRLLSGFSLSIGSGVLKCDDRSLLHGSCERVDWLRSDSCSFKTCFARHCSRKQANHVVWPHECFASDVTALPGPCRAVFGKCCAGESIFFFRRP